MTPTYRSRAASVTRALTRAVDTGLTHAGDVVVTAVQAAVRDGYTTGAFVTGRGERSVYATRPKAEGGKRVVRVTTRQTEPPYPAFWERGHVNIFAGPTSGGRPASLVGSRREGRYLRVPKWEPALQESAPEATAAFGDAVQHALRGAVGDAAGTFAATVRATVTAGRREG